MPQPQLRWGVLCLSAGLVALLVVTLAQGSVFPKSSGARRLQEARAFKYGAEGHRLDGRGSRTTQAGDLVIQERCSPEHANVLAKSFRRKLEEVNGWTACGESKWISQLHQLLPTGPKTFFDIGCNKGYTSAKFFGLWAPEVGFNPRAITARRPEVWCGNCADCQEETHPVVKESKGGVSVYCFEPSQTNFANLIVTRDLFFQQNKPDVQWLTINQAMTNTSGSTHFSRECTSEQCSLDAKSQRNYDLINTDTVDSFMAKQNIDHIDVLKIDTEGFDATVIMGAMDAIIRGKIGIISFEYHGVGMWREYTLQEVTEWLSSYGYVCYFDGKPTMSRLTGCWDDLYEIYEWSNVVCVPRSHKLYSWMERNSMRYEQFGRQYFEEQ